MRVADQGYIGLRFQILEGSDLGLGVELRHLLPSMLMRQDICPGCRYPSVRKTDVRDSLPKVEGEGSRWRTGVGWGWSQSEGGGKGVRRGIWMRLG